LSLPILVIDLHKLDLRELFEIQSDEIGNIKVFTFRCACARQVDVCNAIVNFEPAITAETVIDCDPAVCKSFR